MTKSGSDFGQGGQHSSNPWAIERQRAAEDAARDTALVNRIGEGDHEALTALYDRHGATVYSIALSILHDEGNAQDVTQDVFVTLWTQPDRYRPSMGRFAPWFYRVARNRSIDILRRRRREVMIAETTVFDIMLGPSDDSPPDTVIQVGQARLVRAALSELPEEQRTLIELAYFGGLSQSQMASQLDLPLGTIKTRVRTGLQHLRQMLTE